MKLRSCVEMEDRVPEEAESDLTCLVDQKNGDRMIKQLLNLVISKYRDLLCLADQLFATAFGFGKYLICLPLTNHDILLNLVQ